ncbi:hypothetical protein [Modestobacter sp. Leaf380]|uniref:hypothetical protein n=1 Tax=Modestobacter sp. Leaf380 TaxID=1736356 RepID=UPI0006FE75F5|nr:hypothetical protein [Modestobacter sp. Leaf380]KQS66690.1 hypothetical protein ASG41_09575 [Modestobacter sp. Leaf380]
MSTTLASTPLPETGVAQPPVPDPLTDGAEDRLVTVTRAAAVGQPSPSLLAARQLLDEAEPHARRSAADHARTSRRRHELRGLLADRRAARRAD